jgi:glycosyltransferase involved in cell wall biosynthesis
VREIDYIERHPRLVIVIPAYNSARHIGSTVAQALSYAQQVIVVDDASDDATAEIAYQAGATVVQHQQHTGSSEAIATAFGKAREYTPDMIVVLPGSSQHSTSDLSSVLQPVRDATADIVIGTREAEDTSETRPIYAFSARAFQVLSFCADGFATEEALRSLADEYDLQCVGVRSEHTPPRPPHTRHMEGLPRLNQPYRPLFLLGSVGGMLMLLGTFPGTWGIQFEQSTHSFVSGYSFFNIVLILVSACLIGVGFLLYLTRNITFAQHAQSSTDA